MDTSEPTMNIASFTTFGLPAEVAIFRARTEDDIVQYFALNTEMPFILGGGSNIIVSPAMTGRTVLKVEIPGIYITRETPEEAYIFVGAGEIWDEVVAWAVHKKLSGIEALSAIPGTAGATPVQNVGAYGSEIKDVLVSVRAYDIQEKRFVELSNEECDFSYRFSIFKGKEKGRYVITSMILHLLKGQPNIPDYPAVRAYFKEREIESPSVSEIRTAITEIRWSKLPNPVSIPNCGSFFENPIISKDLADTLRVKYPDMPQYDLGKNQVKIPAGWLMEKAGLKGAVFGAVGTYPKNALVLTNLGGATYDDVLHAKSQIIERVKELFGITLETEPEFV